MKNKRRWLPGVILFLAAAMFLTGLASNARYRADADLLNELGLFWGTEQGYGLDRVMSRAEAGAMLVRLLGEENRAARGDWAHPFRDVAADSWAEQAVGYLYDRGLVKGVTETRFAPERSCSRQMFSAFVLRALGYTEAAGDFTYGGAAAFAAHLGLIPPKALEDEMFLREYAAAISRRALGAPLKDGSMSLFDKLVQQGAISPTAAAAHPELSLL